MTDGVTTGRQRSQPSATTSGRRSQEQGFSTPTEPQRLAIPPLAAGKRTVSSSPPRGPGRRRRRCCRCSTGFAREDRFGFGALYVTPLRALNRDMRQRLDWWGDALDLRIDVRHGDTTDYQRQKQANNPPDVLVTTPKRSRRC